MVAINSGLHAQTRHSPHRYDRDRGYVCTFSALVLKSASAHLFHVGDARTYRLRDGGLEHLTEDHRVRVSADTRYLGRALGHIVRASWSERMVTYESMSVVVVGLEKQ